MIRPLAGVRALYASSLSLYPISGPFKMLQSSPESWCQYTGPEIHRLTAQIVRHYNTILICYYYLLCYVLILLCCVYNSMSILRV